MSAIDWVVWGVSVFGGGFVWVILNPVFESFLGLGGPSTTMSFLTYAWNFGLLAMFLIFPTIWLYMRYQKSEYEVRR